jgi:Cu/Zn superoxide dismutase
VHIYTETVHIYTQTVNIYTTQQYSTHLHTNGSQNREKSIGQCPVFASYTLEFALQLRKKHGKPSVMVAKP